MTIQEPDGPTYFAYNHADLVTEIKFKSGITNYFYYDAQLRRYANSLFPSAAAFRNSLSYARTARER